MPKFAPSYAVIKMRMIQQNYSNDEANPSAVSEKWRRCNTLYALLYIIISKYIISKLVHATAITIWLGAVKRVTVRTVLW